MGVRPAIAVLIGPFSGPVHGVSVINAKLADRLTKRGMHVECIDLSPGAARRGPLYHLTRAARTVRGLVRVLTASAPDNRRNIISVDGGVGLVYNIVLAFGARIRGQAMQLYHHSTRYVLADSMLMRLLLAIAGRDVPHIFCSEKMAALFQARYDAGGRVTIINNAAWVDPSVPGCGSRGGLRLGFLSALTPEKGLGRAIETLRQTRNQGLDAELVLAGTIRDPKAREMVGQAQAEFGGALTYRGELTGADKAAFYGGLDVFLFPSLYPHETQSLVVPEALAAGTPVVAYDHRFVGEILGEGGLLIHAAESFADQAAGWIAQSRDERQARREAARRQFGIESARAAGQIDQLILWAGGPPA